MKTGEILFPIFAILWIFRARTTQRSIAAAVTMSAIRSSEPGAFTRPVLRCGMRGAPASLLACAQIGAPSLRRRSFEAKSQRGSQGAASKMSAIRTSAPDARAAPSPQGALPPRSLAGRCAKRMAAIQRHSRRQRLWSSSRRLGRAKSAGSQNRRSRMWRCSKHRYTARTSCTSGMKWRSRFSMPCRSVAVDEGHPAQAPRICRNTMPSS